jgi:phage-related protein
MNSGAGDVSALNPQQLRDLPALTNASVHGETAHFSDTYSYFVYMSDIATSVCVCHIYTWCQNKTKQTNKQTKKQKQKTVLDLLESEL